MSDFSSINPITYDKVNLVLPLVYDDSMSYVELNYKILQKLNELITNNDLQNSVITSIEGVNVVQDTKIAGHETRLLSIETLDQQITTDITTLEARCGSIESVNTTQNEDINALKGRVTGTEQKNVSQDSLIVSANTNISALQGRCTSIEGVNTTQTSNISGLQDRCNAIEGVNTTQNSNISGLTTRMDAVEGRATAVEDVNATQTTDINTLESRCDTIEGNVSKTEKLVYSGSLMHSSYGNVSSIDYDLNKITVNWSGLPGSLTENTFVKFYFKPDTTMWNPVIALPTGVSMGAEYYVVNLEAFPGDVFTFGLATTSGGVAVDLTLNPTSDLSSFVIQGITASYWSIIDLPASKRYRVKIFGSWRASASTIGVNELSLSENVYTCNIVDGITSLGLSKPSQSNLSANVYGTAEYIINSEGYLQYEYNIVTENSKNITSNATANGRGTIKTTMYRNFDITKITFGYWYFGNGTRFEVYCI